MVRQGNAKQFPHHHDVRFAQHQLQVVDSVLHNLIGCREVWEDMADPPSNSNHKKAEARSILKLWNKGQVWLTTLTGDILDVYQTLQKKLQRSDLLLFGVKTIKAAAVKKLVSIEKGAFSGHREEQNLMPDVPGNTRATQYSLVATNHCDAAIRKETICSAKEYLDV